MITRLEYEITVTDHVAKLNTFVEGSAVGRNFTWFAYCAIVGLAWLSAILFYVRQGHQNYAYVLSGTVALALTVSLPTLYRWYQNAFWSSVFTPAAVQGLVGRKVLTIGDDHVEEMGERMTIRAYWRDVQRIDEGQESTSLVLAPLLAIVIPNRAFDNSAARDSFVQECKTRIAKSDAMEGPL